MTLFDFDTVHGVIPVLDRFHVVDGKLKLANPFYDPRPITNATPTRSNWTTGAPAERLGLIPAGQERILQQEDGTGPRRSRPMSAPG